MVCDYFNCKENPSLVEIGTILTKPGHFSSNANFYFMVSGTNRKMTKINPVNPNLKKKWHTLGYSVY